MAPQADKWWGAAPVVFTAPPVRKASLAFGMKCHSRPLEGWGGGRRGHPCVPRQDQSREGPEQMPMWQDPSRIHIWATSTPAARCDVLSEVSKASQHPWPPSELCRAQDPRLRASGLP